MKTRIALLLFLITITSFSCTTKINESEIEKGDSRFEVNNLLDNWHKDAAETNLNDYFSLMHDDFVFIGTDGTENWDKESFYEFCKPYFEQGRAWDFKVLERNIYFNNNEDFAWFDEILDTDLGPCRGTGVIENIDGEWLLHQYVLSMLVDNDDVREVLELKFERDSVLLSNF
ncbi:MAG: hypothetical protein C0596_15220 [Marinilabiliales bacterium]|nr:MAG: hypothetical protein C0596_15220 [Marinilabiliales bacterium]